MASVAFLAELLDDVGSRRLMPHSEHDGDSGEHVFVLSLHCAECDRRWDDPRDRWRAYVTEDDAPECVLYCQECACREFGDG